MGEIFGKKTYFHLSYSCASPFGLAILVTHDPSRPLLYRGNYGA